MAEQTVQTDARFDRAFRMDILAVRGQRMSQNVEGTVKNEETRHAVKAR
jgi:hypothetical protein